MKKLFIFLTALFLITGCSSDDSNNGEGGNSFAIELEPSATEVVVDEHFTVTVHSEEEIKEVSVSLDNFVTSSSRMTSGTYGTSYTFNFNFDTLGEKTIYIRVKNQGYQISEKQVTINVIRGNAIKINEVQVISFHTIETNTYDLRFGFAKRKLYNYYETAYKYTSWYRSAVIDNQSNMTWDCSSDNLYIVSSPYDKLRFGLGGVISGDVGVDLTNSPGGYAEISFEEYLTTKPSEIIYSFPEYGLEFKLFVDWAN